jgi:hypothetical protein
MMTVLDDFLSFAKRLPAERLQPVEAVLTTLMDSHDETHAFSGDELSELDRRVAEPRPILADQASVDRLMGRVTPR